MWGLSGVIVIESGCEGVSVYTVTSKQNVPSHNLMPWLLHVHVL